MINKCKKKGSVIPYITVDGVKITKSQAIAEQFGDFYANLGASLAVKIKPRQHNIDDYLNQIPRTLNSVVINGITQQEVERTIDALPNKSSSGCDNVSNTLLKSLKSSISYPLFLIFTQSFNSGVFPTKMKEAEVIPLYKSKEPDHVLNYHSISLLMTISKLLEKLMYKRIYRFLDKNNILYQSQYGFRHQRSCEQAIQEMIGKVLQAKEEGLQCALIFLDLSKAFNTLDHTVLL